MGFPLVAAEAMALKTHPTWGNRSCRNGFLTSRTNLAVVGVDLVRHESASIPDAGRYHPFLAPDQVPHIPAV
jgi:hypothetical protein